MFWNKKEKIKAQEITETNFVEKVMEADTGVLLDFWAPWCGPCKVIGPIIDELAEENQDKQILIGKVNVDQNEKLASVFNVKSIPTLIFIKERKVIESLSGLIPKPNLQEMVDDLIAFDFEEEE